MRFLKQGLAPILIGVILASCASVEVTKITDHNRDTEKGFRYYLPRPYIAVKKPMPVQGEDFFIYGVIQEGHVVQIDVSKLPKGRRASFVGLGSPKLVKVPEVLVANGGVASYTQQAGSANSPDPKTGGTDTGAKQGSTDPGTKTDDQPKEQSETTAHGTFGGNVATNLHPVINDYYDIVYMQDFEEQYAIRHRAGLGYVSGQVNLGNGWVMDGADIKIDNTVLGKFIFNNVDKLIDLGVQVAKTAISPGTAVSGITSSAGTKSPTAVQQAGSARGADASLLKAQLPVGKTVLLRVRIVTVAQPGLYPLLKPKEQSSGAADGPGFVPDKDGRLVPAAGTYHDFVLLPFRPYTSIAYNVCKTVEIEAVSSNEAALVTSNPTPTAPPTATKDPNEVKSNSELSAEDVAATRKFFLGNALQTDDKLDSDLSNKMELSDVGTLIITLPLSSTRTPDEQSALAKQLTQLVQMFPLKLKNITVQKVVVQR